MAWPWPDVCGVSPLGETRGRPVECTGSHLLTTAATPRLLVTQEVLANPVVRLGFAPVGGSVAGGAGWPKPTRPHLTRRCATNACPSGSGVSAHSGHVVEMGESRTPRPESFAGDHYERVRSFSSTARPRIGTLPGGPVTRL